MPTVAVLNIGLKANTRQLQSGLKSAGALIKGFGKGVLAAGAVGAGAVAGLAVGIRKSANEIDNLAKAASRIGVLPDELQKLRFAGVQAGLSIEGVDKAAEKLGIQLSKAGQGTGEAVNALKDLNLSASDLLGMRMEDRVTAISKAFANIKNPADRARVAYELFGRSGTQMVTLMNQGADAIQKTFMEAEQLGITLSTIETSRIEAMNDALFKSGQAVTGVRNRIAVELAPTITAIANGFLGAAKDARGFAAETSAGVEFVNQSLAKMQNLLSGIRGLWKQTQGAASGFIADALEFLGKKGLAPGFSAAFHDTVNAIRDEGERLTKEGKGIFDAALGGEAGKSFLDAIRQARAEAEQAAQNARQATGIPEGLGNNIATQVTALKTALKSAPAALERGTIAAARQALTLQSQRDNGPAIESQQLAEQKRQTGLLSKIAKQTKEAGIELAVAGL